MWGVYCLTSRSVVVLLIVIVEFSQIDTCCFFLLQFASSQIEFYFEVCHSKPDDKWSLFSLFHHFSSQMKSLSQTFTPNVISFFILFNKGVFGFSLACYQMIFPPELGQLFVIKFDFLNLRKHSWKTFCLSQNFFFLPAFCYTSIFSFAQNQLKFEPSRDDLIMYCMCNI